MNNAPRTRTDSKILADALDILARDIQSDDGIANAAIAEGAQRIRELGRELSDSHERNLHFLHERDSARRERDAALTDAKEFRTARDWELDNLKEARRKLAEAQAEVTELKATLKGSRAVRIYQENEALKAEIARLQAGGCARDQKTTQFCAEAVNLAAKHKEKMKAADAAIVSAWAEAMEAKGERDGLAMQVEKLTAELAELKKVAP